MLGNNSSNLHNGSGVVEVNGVLYSLDAEGNLYPYMYDRPPPTPDDYDSGAESDDEFFSPNQPSEGSCIVGDEGFGQSSF